MAIVLVADIHKEYRQAFQGSFNCDLMKLTLNIENVEKIRKDFALMNSKEDFIDVLNYTRKVIYGDDCSEFRLASLNYYANPDFCDNRYRTFSIKKKSGGERTIHAPVKGLKSFLRVFNVVLRCIAEPHEAATGFVIGKSIVDNAKVHTGSKYVLNLDLKDFFHSFDRNRVKLVLMKAPFYLNKDREPLAFLMAALCTHPLDFDGEIRNVLPQGSPVSPVMTNLLCVNLDKRLTGVANRFGVKYSRYADDITFSSMHSIFNKEEFTTEVRRIIAEDNVMKFADHTKITGPQLQINEKKTRLQKSVYRQEVTGLTVNEKVNVRKRYVKQIRMWLYYWEKYGYEKAQQLFLSDYIADKGHVKNGKPEMVNVISGKLEFLKMVKGADNELYLKLKGRFEKRITTNINSKTISEAEITTNILANQVRITLEVDQTPEMNEKLNKSINIPKDTVLPSTIIVPNSIEKIEEVLEDSKQNKLLPHNPLYTISFLKKFKIGDGSGFKELVHDVVLSDETVLNILDKVKSHPNFISHYKGEKLVNVSFLNRGIVMSVRELIYLFENQGLPYYKNSHKHPFNNDIKYTNYAKQFKKKYRYGSGSEYSKLQTDIINIFNDQRVPVSSLSFMPDERKFNIRSSFFTWQPAIYNGIRYIVQGISDHSNINGVRSFDPTTKKILVEVERIQLETLSFVELRIFDRMSIAKIDSSTLLQFFQGSSPFKFDFRNLCDWIVECDFLDESSKRLNLLIAPEYSQSFQEIENLQSNVSGFKHILRFYDIR